MSEGEQEPQHLVLGGRYRLLQRLGSGGMADVFLAEQLSLGRKVALKVLRRSLANSADMAARFKREALILSTVDHPGVVRVLDFDSGPDGNVLVLEYVEGPRLDVALKDQSFSPARSRALLQQLAEGLAAIHARGIVHRDFKPENIVLSQGPNGEVARLLDFGVARLLEEDGPSGEGRNFVTNASIGAGTPAYIAPEQVRGLPPTPATDVYAFGVTAFRVLSGSLPFAGPSLDDFLKQHVDLPPPELATLAPDAARADPQLVALVMRCLEKDPAKRPADGAALVDALEGSPQARRRRSGARLRAMAWSLAFLVSAAAGLVPLAVVYRPWLPSTQAQLLLQAGRAGLAMQVLDSSAAQEPSNGARASVRTQALLAAGNKDAVKGVLATACYRSLIPASAEFVAQVKELVREDEGGAACLAAAAKVHPAER